MQSLLFILLQSGLIGHMFVQIFLWLLVAVIFIFIVRWLGAWMFKINEVISLQKEILEELKKSNSKGE